MVPTLRGLTPTPGKVVASIKAGTAGAGPGPRGLTPTPKFKQPLSTWRLAKQLSKSNLLSLLGVSTEPILLFTAGVLASAPVESGELGAQELSVESEHVLLDL